MLHFRRIAFMLVLTAFAASLPVASAQAAKTLNLPNRILKLHGGPSTERNRG